MIRVEPITLELNGLRLEPLSLGHAAGLRAAASDGELWNIRVTSVPEPHNVEQYISTALGMADRMAFAVVDTASGAVIGTTSYHDIVAAVDRVEIGWTWYAKSRQRSHVNTSCKLLLLTHAFDTLGCAVVGLRTDHLNFASQAAIERIGATKDGVLRHFNARRDGTVRDAVMYSILRSEWPGVNARLRDKLHQHQTPC
ncbi:GNAT family N-acetyltransferase [Massilia soli]|uniref:GNAT family N-acetyltransferase n=1 Tax=Massilia soli TaxID=2792854 RepID=A0ABS7SPD3_9BURK|nr:GNAT family protein [Massilia soli]MBZ2207784.1 GNAT family N-acetyltransferase [Massilia soli]